MLGSGFGAVFQSDVPQIAYESDPEGNWDIFLLDLNTHLTHNLTRHPAADTQPAWSEATGKIAFVSNRNKAWLTAIYEMDRYGREVRMLKSGDLNYWRPAWSPDGRELVVMRGFKDIYIIEVETERERQVAMGFSPVWSPVEDRITYYSDHPKLDNVLNFVELAATPVTDTVSHAGAQRHGSYSHGAGAHSLLSAAGFLCAVDPYPDLARWYPTTHQPEMSRLPASSLWDGSAQTAPTRAP